LDFNLETYKLFIKSLQSNGFKLHSFNEYVINKPENKICILRHDIDRASKHIQHFAEFEQQNGIKATYYFPTKLINNSPDLIKKIAALGHEIGYHYNDFSLSPGNFTAAFKSLKINLEKLRKLVPVNSLCMDGKPLHSQDNRKLWDQFNYKELGILGEIYLEIDYNEFAYYTDTGRKWNNKNINVRDKVVTNKEWPVYKSTFEMINAIKAGTFPEKAVINIHPEHWTDNSYDWTKKLVWQSFKNVFKFVLIKVRKMNRTN